MRRRLVMLAICALTIGCGDDDSATGPSGSTWTRSGTGNTVFDKPAQVDRVRITGTYAQSSSNFIINCSGRLIVNELLGTVFGRTAYDGTHRMNDCTLVEITNSTGVTWTFTEQR